MLDRTRAIIVKESRELLRDPIYLGLAFIVPILLMILFGYGFTTDVKHLPLAFLDHDRSPVSRDYIDGFIHSEYFDFIGILESADQADAYLKSGDARVIIDIPPHFTRDLTGGEPTTISVMIDGSFPTRAAVITGYVTAINGLYNRRLLEEFAARQGMGGNVGIPVNLDMTVWYNPSLESKNFIVPGMMVVIMMMFPAILGALLIVRERETGTIFNLFASPVRRWEIILGKAAPYVAVSMVDYVLIFVMSIWLFQVRFIGSFWVLSMGALLYSICTVGMGMLVSVLTRTQLAAMLITFLVTMTPAFNYSGFLAPVASQDAVGQFAARLIPATYFMDVVRGSYLKGLSFGYYWPQLGALAVYTMVIYGATWLFLRKRIG